MRRIISLLFFVFVAAYWGLVTLPAQQRPAVRRATPRFSRPRSNLVLVSVYVRGKDGKPVENLKPEDFTMLENGKQQAISVFDFQRLSDAEIKPRGRRNSKFAPRRGTKPVETRPRRPPARVSRTSGCWCCMSIGPQ